MIKKILWKSAVNRGNIILKKFILSYICTCNKKIKNYGTSTRRNGICWNKCKRFKTKNSKERGYY